MFNTTDIMFIPQHISCPACDTRYDSFALLSALLLPESTWLCENCRVFVFTREYIGKYFGVIKDVRMEKE